MQHNLMKYFVTGHTSEGYVNYVTSNLDGIQHIVVLQHPSNILKTKVLRGLINVYHQEHAIEVICSSLNKDYLEGIIFRSLSFAVFVEEIAENINHVKTTFIPLETQSKKEGLVEMDKEMSEYQNKAYSHFKKALQIHDRLEDVYINEMDFSKADKIAEEFIESVFSSEKPQIRPSIIYERLFATNTPSGFINYLEMLIEPIRNRIFIKGRAGTGKSFFMHKVLKQCKLFGYDVDLYRCSFDPNSIDMLVIKVLDLCLFDSTPPHELFPNRKTDKIIDFYEKTVTPGTDEKYAALIDELTSVYKSEIKVGMRKLSMINALDKAKEQVWKNVNEEEVQFFIHKVVKSI